MTTDELDLATTEDLVEALSRRCRSMVLAYVKEITPDETTSHSFFRGSFVECEGLCGAALRRVRQAADEMPDVDAE